eukprot:CAMPEP_0201520604 /NCGR_PEP_ID=MMETSP0161_2-20130828/11983_1 /ASSEMBLY_ACC=CAM_ASM_000251 /TAXON_ID=180227 /ORGANISM="Neoparamoeba aestuarina, Strain SoJaBio B1-5/56/2" /LENGTH=486 /DNA_ID=CAMNT_0047919037 /DNA_START=272 /DNA_END=1728 /DNA_ORIENTATION=-
MGVKFSKEAEKALAAPNNKKAVEKVFGQLDKDKSGGLSKEEFRVFARIVLEKDLGDLKKEGGGAKETKMEFDEAFGKIAKQVKANNIDEFVEHMFKVADVDKDGNLTYEEFHSFLQKHEEHPSDLAGMSSTCSWFLAEVQSKASQPGATPVVALEPLPGQSALFLWRHRNGDCIAIVVTHDETGIPQVVEQPLDLGFAVSCSLLPLPGRPGMFLKSAMDMRVCRVKQLAGGKELFLEDYKMRLYPEVDKDAWWVVHGEGKNSLRLVIGNKKKAKLTVYDLNSPLIQPGFDANKIWESPYNPNPEDTWKCCAGWPPLPAFGGKAVLAVKMLQSEVVDLHDVDSGDKLGTLAINVDHNLLRAVVLKGKPYVLAGSGTTVQCAEMVERKGATQNKRTFEQGGGLDAEDVLSDLYVTGGRELWVVNACAKGDEKGFLLKSLTGKGEQKVAPPEDFPEDEIFYPSQLSAAKGGDATAICMVNSNYNKPILL